MRYECNAENEADFNEMMDYIHNEDRGGFNFEVGARMFQTLNNKTIMIEHQITTKECRELVENDDEPDWLTAYLVESEDDYDCSQEIFTETIENNIKYDSLKDCMLEFSQKVFEEYL